MLDRLTAFGKPSERHLFSDHSCSAQGKGQFAGKPRMTIATVRTGVGLDS